MCVFRVAHNLFRYARNRDEEVFGRQITTVPQPIITYSAPRQSAQKAGLSTEEILAYRNREIGKAERTP